MPMYKTAIWGMPQAKSPKLHYFEGEKSICGKYRRYLDLFDEVRPSFEFMCCKKCLAKLAKRP